MVSNVSNNSALDRQFASELISNQGSLKNNTTNTIKSAGQAGSVQASNESDSFKMCAAMGIGSAAVFEGYPLAKYLWRNKKLKGEMTPEMKKLSESTQNAFKNLIHGKGKLTERLGNYLSTVNTNKSAYQTIKDITEAKAKMPDLEKKLAQKSVNAAVSPNFYTKWKLGNAEKALTKTITEAEKSITQKAGSKFSIGKMFKSPGVAFMAVIGGVIEGVTEIYPTFKELGAEKGFKQLGKSALKVAGDTAGFIIGDQAGIAIGSAIGTALFPGIGTAIGAATGLVAGMFGSYAASHITEKIIGKSELEIAKEKQAQQLNGAFALTA